MNIAWSRGTALVAGLALIVVTNGIALGGVAWNRGGEPDSVLALTQRELRPTRLSGPDRDEYSGLEMRLQWRVAPLPPRRADDELFDASGYGAPAWLDMRKMASLGFDTSGPLPVPGSPEGTRFTRQLPRDVLVVLELEGPAYRARLEAARDAAREIEARNARGTGAARAAEVIDRETNRASRLFAVDAGLDREALRARYPDRSMYAIVHAQVRPLWDPDRREPGGIVSSVSAESINVPLQMRATVEGASPVRAGRRVVDGPAFEARLAFGRRLEPWLLAVRSLKSP